MHTKRFVTLAGAAFAAALALSACSNDSGSNHDMSSMTTSAAASSPSAAAGGDAQAQAHNDADVAFAQGMIPHHQQAIEMSDMLLAKQGVDPRVVSLATEIKAAQGPEIEQMQGWLADWGASPAMTSPSSGMPNMPGHDMGSMGGGGMMSEQDMTALRDAQGVEASRLFLTQMIEHHKGAIAMSQTEQNSGQFAPAVALARSIIASQQKEIDTMQQMLTTL
ncbi:DUF305 domain-containing protein [Mycolicibacterium cosmeticum]|uniref:DUF305 domain-containing protein n=1 Tax=Mycolicibacterium cosmeticum TaxID=258533 RepID=UPI0032046975